MNDTLLLFEGIPRALKGGRLRLKDLLLLSSIFEEMNSFQSFKSEGRICTIGEQFLEHYHLI